MQRISLIIVGLTNNKGNACVQHGIATIAGSEVFSGSLPRFGFITADSDEARKSATVAIPGPLAAILRTSLLLTNNTLCYG
jgi:hypothetical protein